MSMRFLPAIPKRIGGFSVALGVVEFENGPPMLQAVVLRDGAMLREATDCECVLWATATGESVRARAKEFFREHPTAFAYGMVEEWIEVEPKEV